MEEFQREGMKKRLIISTTVLKNVKLLLLILFPVFESTNHSVITPY